jgi:hypothetical protein
MLHFCHSQFKHIAPPGPLRQRLQLVQPRNHQFWQCHGIMHIEANDVTLLELVLTWPGGGILGVKMLTD